MLLENKVAIITGPAKGMGSAITLKLATEGADVFLVGRDTEAVEPVAAEVRSMGRQATVFAGDITVAEDMQKMAEAAASKHGRIDVLVTVAGVSRPLEKTLWETDEAEYDAVMAANARGIFLPNKAVMPFMVRQRGGRIVNIGGTYGMRGRGSRGAYSASKWAMRGLTRSLALEAGEFNINVNAVMPGSVWGPRLERVLHARAERFGVTYEAMKAVYESELALRRIPVAEDIANAVLFLASDMANTITGQELVVDGGWVI
jgi:3-oxoacyl-[acyl-carrier protein] reductase